MVDTTTTETVAKANGELIASAYDAFARGDLQGAIATFAADIFWHVPGRGPLSRDYRGHAEVLGFFGHFMEPRFSGRRDTATHSEALLPRTTATDDHVLLDAYPASLRSPFATGTDSC